MKYAAIRFYDKNEARENEVLFSSNVYAWKREELRSLITFFAAEYVEFPNGMKIKDLSPLDIIIDMPYTTQLKDIDDNYENKLFFLLKKDGKKGFVSKYKLLSSRQYIFYATVENNVMKGYVCKEYQSDIKTFKNFIPVFTSSRLAESFTKEVGDDEIKKYKPVKFNYRRIAKMAAHNGNAICFNCNSPILHGKDFSYFLPNELLKVIRNEK
jgi:hypothetical protein